MRVWRKLRYCLIISLLTSGELYAQTRIAPAVFQTVSRMVLVPVTVTDRNGKTLDGLRAKDFTIFDNQTPQQIVSFATEDTPCSVGLVLDISGSMQNILSMAKNITRSFLGVANTDDQFLLLTVSTRPDEMAGFTTDLPALEKKIAVTRPGGMTALIDTVYLGLNQMRKARLSRRALLVVSDGMDNHSRYTKGELLRVALEADVQVYTIVMDNPAALNSGNTMPFRPAMIKKGGDHAAERAGPQMLQELSARTGGLYFQVSKDSEGNVAALKAGRAIRNQYVIGYQPPESGPAETWHRVRVKSDVPKTKVYARSGYYSR